MSSMTFAREPFTAQLLGEMLPLLEKHWAEVAHYPDIPLEVDASAYHAAESNGMLRIYTVRDGEAHHCARCDRPEVCDVIRAGTGPCGENSGQRPLVGYAAYFVRANPHYRSSVQASQDVIYVSPAARGSTGARLIRFADEQLASEGVQAVYHHVKTAHNWGRLLERMGYEAVDVIYAKRLDRVIIGVDLARPGAERTVVFDRSNEGV